MNIKRQEAERKAGKLLSWVFCSTRSHLDGIRPIVSGNFNLNENMTAVPKKSHVPKSCRSFIFETEPKESSFGFETEQNEIEISLSSVRDYLALKFSYRLEAYKCP